MRRSISSWCVSALALVALVQCVCSGVSVASSVSAQLLPLQAVRCAYLGGSKSTVRFPRPRVVSLTGDTQPALMAEFSLTVTSFNRLRLTFILQGALSLEYRSTTDTFNGPSLQISPEAATFTNARLVATANMRESATATFPASRISFDDRNVYIDVKQCIIFPNAFVEVEFSNLPPFLSSTGIVIPPVFSSTGLIAPSSTGRSSSAAPIASSTAAVVVSSTAQALVSSTAPAQASTAQPQPSTAQPQPSTAPPAVASTGVAPPTGGQAASSTGAPIGGAAGDPQISGFLGQEFQVHGTANTVYNVISSARLQYNALFSFLSEGACRAGTECFAHPGNYFGAVGIQIATDKGSVVKLEVQAGPVEEGMKVTVDGEPLMPTSAHLAIDSESSLHFGSPFELLLQTRDYTLRLQNSDMFLNQQVSIREPLLEQIKQFKSKAITDVSQLPHGILGQTWRRMSYANRWVHLEGDLMSYIVADGLFGVPSEMNRFKLEA